MEKNFLIHNEFSYSYDKLLIDINSKEHGSTFLYIKDNHPYHVFLAVIHSLLYDYPSVQMFEFGA